MFVSVFDFSEHLSAGDYSTRLGSFSDDECGKLGETLNVLAGRIQSQVHEISNEQSHLSVTLANMTDGVVVVDSENRIVLANPALTSFLGVTLGEVTRKPFLEVLRHSQLNELLKEVHKYKKEKIEEVRTFDPEERFFQAHAIPLRANEHTMGAMLVLRDMTPFRRLEKIRRDFIGNVSHELRTPLASIKGFAETLLSGGLEDKKNRVDFVKAIEKHADGMTALVEDLLDLTAIESGQRPPRKETIDLASFLEEVVHGFKPLGERKKIEINLQMGKNSILVEADKNQLRQVISNLVDNAIKFNQPHGSVFISAQQEEGSVSISIRDTGLGIAPQDLPRIFERFYRADKARSKELGGTGLGLSIVKHIVDTHGGSIRVESELGRGTTFFLSLPIINH